MKEHFFGMGMEIGGILHLSPREAFDAIAKDVFIIDIRRDFEVAGKKISGVDVIYIPFSDLQERFQELSEEKSYLVMDAVGMRSKDAVRFLVQNGFNKVASLNGGIVDWEKDGLPLLIDKGELLTGSCLCQLRPKKKFKKE